MKGLSEQKRELRICQPLAHSPFSLITWLGLAELASSLRIKGKTTPTITPKKNSIENGKYSTGSFYSNHAFCLIVRDKVKASFESVARLCDFE
jgi:hypothetical protein